MGKYSVELAIVLHERGSHAISCAAGIGADICGFTDSAKTENMMNLLIDGCPVGSIKAILITKLSTEF